MSLLRFKPDQKYMVYDTETESLNLRFSRPWQMAYVIWQPNKGILKEVNRNILWPDFNISKDAARITRFYEKEDEFLATAKSPEEIWEEIAEDFFNEEFKQVGHNIIGFDIYQMQNWARAIGVDLGWGFLERSIDTNCLAKAIAKNITPDRKNFLAWQFNMANEIYRGLKTNLTALAKQYEVQIDPDKMHDALEDIRVNAKVFGKQLYEIEI